MTGVRVEVDIGRARDVIDKYIKLVGNPRPLMEVAGGVLENSVRDRFRTGVGPGGVPWIPSRRAIEQGGSTLIDKGGLLNSITHVADDRRVEVGVIAKTESAKHAATHQFGATIRPVHANKLAFRAPDGHLVLVDSVTIPARPFLGIDEEDRNLLMEAWVAMLEGVS